MSEEDSLDCWMKGCGKTFPDNGRGREGRKIHWEYVHAGLESEDNVERVDKNQDKKFSVVDIWNPDKKVKR